MRFDVSNDILGLIVQRVNDIPCLKHLFCVNKGFKVNCKKQFTTMNREMESKLRDEIHLLLSEPSPQVPDYPKLLMKVVLYKEFFLNSKQTVLNDAESAFESETRSIDELKVKTKQNSKTDGLFDDYTSILTAAKKKNSNFLESTKQYVSLLCRNTTDDSKAIWSKVRDLVSVVETELDKAILRNDDISRDLFVLGRNADRISGQALHARLDSCMLRIEAIMKDRLLIGARTITQMEFSDNPGVQPKVEFVRNSGLCALPFTHAAETAPG